MEPIEKARSQQRKREKARSHQRKRGGKALAASLSNKALAAKLERQSLCGKFAGIAAGGLTRRAKRSAQALKRLSPPFRTVNRPVFRRASGRCAECGHGTDRKDPFPAEKARKGPFPPEKARKGPFPPEKARRQSLCGKLERLSLSSKLEQLSLCSKPAGIAAGGLTRRAKRSAQAMKRLSGPFSPPCRRRSRPAAFGGSPAACPQRQTRSRSRPQIPPRPSTPSVPHGGS